MELPSIVRSIGAPMLAALVVGACGHRVVSTATASDSEVRSVLRLADDAEVRSLGRGVFIYANMRDGESVNAVLIEDDAGAVLIDTGPDRESARALIAWARDVRRRPIRAAIITSADDDRLGGEPALTEAGIPVFATNLTRDLASVHGRPLAVSVLEPDSVPGVRWMLVRISPNPEAIVVYHAATRTLAGGRFVEAFSASRVSRADDDALGLRAALDLVAASYPEAERVVPGRGEPGTLALLEHTRLLVAECRSDDECIVTPEEFGACACCGCTEPRAMPRATAEVLRSERLSCEPVCEGVACPACPAPEALPRAVCRRGECAL